MTPLQKVAMGLVIVALDAFFGEFDAVPDVLGWLLVLLGLHELRGRVEGLGALATLASISAAVSTAQLWPHLFDAMTGSDQSIGWALSLPQLLFSVLTCTALLRLAEPSDPARARMFGWLRWVFGAAILAPAVGYGGGVEQIVVAAGVVTMVANVALIYLLFTVSTQPYAGASEQ